MIIQLQVYELDTCFMGESLELCINSNIPEIASTPIEFYGATAKEVIDQVKQYARFKFPSGGSIRLV